MVGTIKGRNKRAAIAAKREGRNTFQKEVVDYEPACSECSKVLRVRGLGNNRNRTCGCPGKRWEFGLTGWRVMA